MQVCPAFGQAVPSAVTQRVPGAAQCGSVPGEPHVHARNPCRARLSGVIITTTIAILKYARITDSSLCTATNAARTNVTYGLL
jgi:hypothetical protein